MSPCDVAPNCLPRIVLVEDVIVAFIVHGTCRQPDVKTCLISKTSHTLVSKQKDWSRNAALWGSWLNKVASECKGEAHTTRICWESATSKSQHTQTHIHTISQLLCLHLSYSIVGNIFMICSSFSITMYTRSCGYSGGESLTTDPVLCRPAMVCRQCLGVRNWYPRVSRTKRRILQRNSIAAAAASPPDFLPDEAPHCHQHKRSHPAKRQQQQQPSPFFPDHGNRSPFSLLIRSKYVPLNIAFRHSSTVCPHVRSISQCRITMLVHTEYKTSSSS